MLFVLYCFNVQLHAPHIILTTIFLFRKKYREALQTRQSEGYTQPILKLQLQQTKLLKSKSQRG